MGTGRSYVIALDQGTTSSRAVLVDRSGRMVDVAQRPFQQIYPQPGWVEHNPQVILFSQLGTLSELVARHGLTSEDIDAIGIDNQRETTIVWDRSTGVPISNAIVWQCRRTAEMVERVCGPAEVSAMVREKTGLLPDPYFSASKIAWILDHVPGARDRARSGDLLFGTVDTWLVWTLTGGLVHATDPTNASRTMLYNIHEGRWDEDLLALFDIPACLLPEVRPSSGLFGETSYPGLPAGIPITGVAGDQQAALFGQCCFEPGQAKNTYGTGCFMLLNTGDEARSSEHGLVTTIAAAPPDARRTQYALEGSVLVGGHDVRELTCDSLLRNFSAVFQNVYLFNDTIESNIRFGRPGATHEEVVEAARRARVDEFVRELPDGYETLVGEAGSALSGGQKQRISIARALLKDAPIVILDEATASIDPENESLIQEALSELTRGKTVVVIAHRLATIEHADQILVVEGGRIVQRGTHEELLGQEGTYRHFVEIRRRAEGWRIGEETVAGVSGEAIDAS